MSKSNALENDLLKLLFNGTAIANIADNAASSPLGNLYVSLHTADPGEAGDQETDECAYTGYARVAVARTTGGFTVTGNSVSPVGNIDFPKCTGGSETATYFGIGTDPSGGGKLLYSGLLVDPNDIPTPLPIAISNGVTPRLTTATAITED